MDRTKKTPGVAFWAALVVVVPVLYLAIFGPYLWLHHRFTEPNWIDRATDIFFAPATWMYQSDFELFSDRYRRYCWWWAERGKKS